METTLNIVSIIIIVFGVLQIILFFKVWGMTNDTRKIKNTVQANGYPTGISPAKIEIAIGNIDKAKELAMREFVFEVYKLYLDMPDYSNSVDKEYLDGFNIIERKYRDMFNDASSIIDFSKFSTYKKAEKMFR